VVEMHTKRKIPSALFSVAGIVVALQIAVIPALSVPPALQNPRGAQATGVDLKLFCDSETLVPGTRTVFLLELENTTKAAYRFALPPAKGRVALVAKVQSGEEITIWPSGGYEPSMPRVISLDPDKIRHVVMAADIPKSFEGFLGEEVSVQAIIDAPGHQVRIIPPGTTPPPPDFRGPLPMQSVGVGGFGGESGSLLMRVVNPDSDQAARLEMARNASDGLRKRVVEWLKLQNPRHVEFLQLTGQPVKALTLPSPADKKLSQALGPWADDIWYGAASSEQFLYAPATQTELLTAIIVAYPGSTGARQAKQHLEDGADYVANRFPTVR
jgi:hypothetical protein